VFHNSKPNVSLITYSRHGNQKFTTQLTQKGQQKHILNMIEIKHPLTLGHSIFPNSRWIIGQSRFKSVLCIWIFPTIKQ
jgi:hypothetical protein